MFWQSQVNVNNWTRIYWQILQAKHCNEHWWPSTKTLALREATPQQVTKCWINVFFLTNVKMDSNWSTQPNIVQQTDRREHKQEGHSRQTKKTRSTKALKTKTSWEMQEFTYVSRSLEQESANYSLWTKSGPPPIFVNKALLEHSNTHWFICGLWLLSHYNGRIE